MKIALISDVHGNLEALEAVLDSAQAAGAGEVVCLGDVAGYGPDPGPCIRLVARSAKVWVLGNHDLAALPEHVAFRRYFREDAQVALDWSEQRLGEDLFDILRALPPAAVGPWGLAAHGTPHDPMRYIMTTRDVLRSLRDARDWDPPLPLPFLWVGHTHLPTVLVAQPNGSGLSEPEAVDWEYDQPIALGPGWWLFNPGSVGQPRDQDPRARWALLDIDGSRAEIKATAYDFRTTQRKMRAARLPSSIISLLGA